MSEQAICDFCGEPKIGRRFLCPDFYMGPGMISTENWMACSACGSMIDAGNWTGLMLRAIQKHSENFPKIPQRILADTIKRTHDRFREHYRKAEQ